MRVLQLGLVFCLYFVSALGITYNTYFPSVWSTKPGQISDDSWAGVGWATPDVAWNGHNGWKNDGSNTITVTLSQSSESHLVRVTGFDTNTVKGLRMLPNDVTVTGIRVRFEVKTDRDWNEAAGWNYVQLLRNNNPAGSHSESNSRFGGTSKSTRWLGTSTSTWGCNTQCRAVSQWKDANSGWLFQTEGFAGSGVTITVYTLQQFIYFNFNIGVTNVNPPASPENGLGGGQVVDIFVSGHLLQVTNSINDIKCKFGSKQGTLHQGSGITTFSPPNQTPNWLKCVTPSQNAPGPYQVTISLDNGATWTTEQVVYYYVVSLTCNPSCAHGTCVYGLCNCQTGWLGPSCSTPDCSNRQNCNGHGTCTAPNTCQCNAGYGGTSCNTFVCPQGCVNGACDGPLQCTCQTGWSGNDCTTPLCNPPCNDTANFECVSPNTCDCKPNYGPGNGNCDIYALAECPTLNECHENLSQGLCIQNDICRCTPGYLLPDCGNADCSSLNDCNSNGFCDLPNHCTCNLGWTGPSCDQFDCTQQDFCNVLDSRGECTGPNTCTCYAGWTGDKCDIPVCDANCQGDCVGPYICVCEPGLIPPACTLPPVPNCEQSNNCSGKGLCAGPEICICDPGWGGVDCETPVCTVLTCQNGFCAAPETCECFTGFKGLECELEDVSPVVLEETKTNVAAIVVPIVLLVILLIVAGVVGFILFRRMKQGYRPKAVAPKYQNLIFGDYVARSVYSYPAVAPSYFDLEQILFEEKYPLLDALINLTPTTELDELARNIMFLAEARGNSIRLFQHFLTREVQEADAATSLFRANSFCTKMFKFYSKMHGLKYLFATLANSIVHLQHEIKQNEIDMEVDPNRLEEGADDVSNKWQLLLITQRLFTSVLRSTDEIPSPLRHLTHIILESVNKRFPENSIRSLGAFWFLRFFCPALVAPHAYGLTQEPPSQELQRHLVLLSKVLQNLANGVSFGGKEAGMVKLNDFLEENKENLNQFYRQIMDPNPSQERIFIPNPVFNNSLAFMHCHLATVCTPDALQNPLNERVKDLLNKLGSPPTHVK